MKLSKVMHVLNVVVGAAGVVASNVAVNIGVNDTLWGVNREHWLLC
jgi:hypothetical protein